jgi:large subunit ribosomal protein L13
MKTYSPKSSEIDRQWCVVDAAGQPLGRIATRIAYRLRGKHKPIYTPHMDTGDFVVVVNAEKVLLSGRKEDQKVYYRHSGRPGSLQAETARRLRRRRPERMLELAVRGMLPKNRLGRSLYRKLKVYAGPDHPHHSQQPVVLEATEA